LNHENTSRYLARGQTLGALLPLLGLDSMLNFGKLFVFIASGEYFFINITWNGLMSIRNLDVKLLTLFCVIESVCFNGGIDGNWLQIN